MSAAPAPSAARRLRLRDALRLQPSGTAGGHKGNRLLVLYLPVRAYSVKGTHTPSSQKRPSNPRRTGACKRRFEGRCRCGRAHDFLPLWAAGASRLLHSRCWRCSACAGAALRCTCGWGTPCGRHTGPGGLQPTPNSRSRLSIHGRRPAGGAALSRHRHIRADSLGTSPPDRPCVRASGERAGQGCNCRPPPPQQHSGPPRPLFLIGQRP